MLISIIIPVRNEELFIENCIQSVLGFELPENILTEIIILDGMSNDKTVEILKTRFNRENIKIMQNPGKIQSTALNMGIHISNGEYILRLDAHAKYPKDYLKKLIETSKRIDADNIGGVWKTNPGGTNYGAQIVQAITTHKFGIGNSNFRVGHKEGAVDTVPFGFYKRSTFDKIGNFDERLVRAQDYEFNRRIIKTGGIIWQNPKIIIDYYNQKFFNKFLKKQFLLEGPYNAYMWYLAPYTFSYRHLITPIFTAGIIFGLILSSVNYLLAYIYLSVLILYLLLALISGVQQAFRYRKFSFVFTLPFSFFLFHFIYGLGTLLGIIRLITKTSPIFKISEPWEGSNIKRAIEFSYLSNIKGIK